MTLCYDSTNPQQIPTSAPIVAGYIDGLYAWSPSEWALFPNAQHVTITVFGAAGARVADCESGDLTVKASALWAQREVSAGRRPTIYSDTSSYSSIVAACNQIGVSRGAWDWWAADPTGGPHLVASSVATQFAWNKLGQTNGRNVDISVTDGSWPGSITPVSPSKPVTVGIAPTTDGKGYWIAAADGGVFAYGNAPFYGSLGGQKLSAPIIDIAACGSGYYLIGADGAVYAFNCTYFGGTNQ